MSDVILASGAQRDGLLSMSGTQMIMQLYKKGAAFIPVVDWGRKGSAGLRLQFEKA